MARPYATWHTPSLLSALPPDTRPFFPIYHTLRPLELCLTQSSETSSFERDDMVLQEGLNWATYVTLLAWAGWGATEINTTPFTRRRSPTP